MSRSSRWNPDDPVPVSASLDRLLKYLRKPSAPVISAVFDRWSSLVGTALAEVSRPVAIAEGVLTVEVDDPVAATQLKWLKTDLLASIRTLSDTAEINDLVVVTTRQKPRPE